jgi:histidine triad (HIT) family protein
MDCIFCKIVSGEIPSVKVYEDDTVFAFMDINPLNDGHLLVIPKAHAGTIHEITEADFVAVMSATHKLAAAVQKALNPEGINLMQLNGRAANQVVPHLHVHIVPRWSGDGLSICKWKPMAGKMEKIQEVAERIRSKVRNRKS